MAEWNADEALKALAEQDYALDVNVHDPAQLAEAISRIFRENAQIAALSIVNTALYDPNSRIRLDAAKYVVEQARTLEGGEGDPLAELMRGLYGMLDDASKQG